LFGAETLVADASVQTLLAGDVVETCGFGADGRGTCVETITHVQTLAASTATENLAITFSGSVVPFYTLPAVPSADQRSAGRVKSWIVLLGILVAVLHAL
jgi:hypothetical protein